MGGGYGYPDITQLAAKIEFQLLSKNYSEVARLLSDMYDLFDRVIMGHEYNTAAIKKVVDNR